MAKLLRGLLGLVACGWLLPSVVQGFDLDQLPRMKERYQFWRRGQYAVLVSKAAFGKGAGTVPTYVRVSMYLATSRSYDRVFYLHARTPLEVQDSGRAVRLSWCDSRTNTRERLRLTAAGVTYELERRWPEGGSGTLCQVMLDPIRFDGATAYEVRDQRVRRYRLWPDQVALRPVTVTRSELSGIVGGPPRGGAPTLVVTSEDGLTVIWETVLRHQGIKRLLSPAVALLGIGPGSAAYRLYNAAPEVEPGGWVELAMRIRFRVTEEYPRQPVRATKLQLFDSHVHVAVDTDVRDSVLMARKHGFRYGLLAILFDEGPYRRRFEGNDPVLALARRYPDVFVPFGLIQLNEHGYPGFRRRGPDGPSDIRQLWRAGFRGLKTLEKWSEVCVDSPRFDALYREAERLGMPIVFHTNPEGTGSSCTRVANVARKFPRLNVIMAHLHDEEQFWKIVPQLELLPNLYIQHMHLDHCRLATGETALEVLVERGLANKIVFGSDMQVDHSVALAQMYQFRRRLRELGVDEPTVQNILWRTMARIVPGNPAGP